VALWSQVSTLLASTTDFSRGELVNDALIKTLVATKNGRTQIVWVEHREDNLIFSSVVCKLEQVNLPALFGSKLMGTLTYGFGAVDDYLVLRHVASLKNLDINELAEPLMALAYLADTLEEAIVGGDAY
jgi:hypothetical protein